MVMVPMALANCSVNQRLLSEPSVMAEGPAPAVGSGYSVTLWVLGSITPIWLALFSVNHRLLSGPTVMPCGPDPDVGIGYSVTTPPTVMRPILLALTSVNHKAPSGPAVIPNGELDGVVTAYSVMTPAVADAADLVVERFGEPHGAIRPHGDPLRHTVGGAERKLVEQLRHRALVVRRERNECTYRQTEHTQRARAALAPFTDFKCHVVPCPFPRRQTSIQIV